MTIGALIIFFFSGDVLPPMDIADTVVEVSSPDYLVRCPAEEVPTL